MIQTIIDGFFNKNECENIKKKMEGRTYFNFEISYSNCAGNCSLILSSKNDNYTPEELKEMFMFACLSELGK